MQSMSATETKKRAPKRKSKIDRTKEYEKLRSDMSRLMQKFENAGGGGDDAKTPKKKKKKVAVAKTGPVIAVATAVAQSADSPADSKGSREEPAAKLSSKKKSKKDDDDDEDEEENEGDEEAEEEDEDEEEEEDDDDEREEPKESPAQKVARGQADAARKNERAQRMQARIRQRAELEAAKLKLSDEQRKDLEAKMKRVEEFKKATNNLQKAMLCVANMSRSEIKVFSQRGPKQTPAASDMPASADDIGRLTDVVTEVGAKQHRFPARVKITPFCLNAGQDCAQLTKDAMRSRQAQEVCMFKRAGEIVQRLGEGGTTHGMCKELGFIPAVAPFQSLYEWTRIRSSQQALDVCFEAEVDPAALHSGDFFDITIPYELLPKPLRMGAAFHFGAISCVGWRNGTGVSFVPQVVTHRRPLPKLELDTVRNEHATDYARTALQRQQQEDAEKASSPAAAVTKQQKQAQAEAEAKRQAQWVNAYHKNVAEAGAESIWWCDIFHLYASFNPALQPGKETHQHAACMQSANLVMRCNDADHECMVPLFHGSLCSCYKINVARWFSADPDEFEDCVRKFDVKCCDADSGKLLASGLGRAGDGNWATVCISTTPDVRTESCVAYWLLTHPEVLTEVVYGCDKLQSLIGTCNPAERWAHIQAAIDNALVTGEGGKKMLVVKLAPLRERWVQHAVKTVNKKKLAFLKNGLTLRLNPVARQTAMVGTKDMRKWIANHPQPAERSRETKASSSASSAPEAKASSTSSSGTATPRPMPAAATKPHNAGVISVVIRFEEISVLQTLSNAQVMTAVPVGGAGKCDGPKSGITMPTNQESDDDEEEEETEEAAESDE